MVGSTNVSKSCSSVESRSIKALAASAYLPRPASRDRIVGEPVGVIAVGMATRDREDPLQQIQTPTPCVTRAGARIGDRRGQGRQQAEASVGRFEQDRAAVRTRVGLIEGGDQGPIGQVRKNRTVCAIVGSFNAIASVWGNAV